MVQQYKKVNKTKTRKYKSKTKSKSKSRNMSRTKRMRGGDGSGGRVALPPAYFTNSPSGLNGYFAPGSSELTSGGQLAVSRGTISLDGTSAGPNLFPMKGGNCGCNKKQKNKKKSKSSKLRKMKK